MRLLGAHVGLIWCRIRPRLGGCRICVDLRGHPHPVVHVPANQYPRSANERGLLVSLFELPGRLYPCGHYIIEND